MFKIIWVLSLITPIFAYNEIDTWKNYQAILNSITKSLHFSSTHGSFKQTAVDYEKLASESSLQDLLVQQKEILATVQIPTTFEDKEIAFWINAYNFFTLVDVSNEPDTESMKDIGWKNDHHLIAGSNYSLDQIEHEILRPKGDTRVHFAINCASVGCPSLGQKIYLSNQLNQQLNLAVKNSLRNPLHLVVEKDGDIEITKLFDWFEEDWGGEDGVLTFIKKYSPFSPKSYGHFSYDWRLNTLINYDDKYKELSEDYPHLNIKTK